MGTVADKEGHLWPVTGLYCIVCGMPLHPANADREMHPTCDPVS
jgi:hypothetical protein